MDRIRNGLIITAPVHKAFDSNEYMPTKNETGTGRKYGLVFFKNRPVIVVGKSKEHFVCLPCFTFNGHGLANKQNKEDYVSVFDHRRHSGSEQQSSHLPLVTAKMWSPDYFSKKSTVHLSYPWSVPYGLKLREEGQLDAESTERLRRLYRAKAFREMA
ncbi:hypothetical protein RUND412_009093 [Rhizina undulata]